ncbi:glutamine synthetase type III [Pedobacter sp. UYEF25]
MNIIESEILALTKEVRKAQKAIFTGDAKASSTDHKKMRDAEKQLDNLITKADALNAAKKADNKFDIVIKLEFDAKGSPMMRPELPGQLVAATAIDALLSSASNIQKMVNAKSGDDVLRKSTIKICELF